MPTAKRQRKHAFRDARQAQALAARRRARLLRRGGLVLAVVAALVVVIYFVNRGNSKSTAVSTSKTSSAQCPNPNGSSPRMTSFSAPPPMCISTNKTYSATVETDVGTFNVDLDAKSAPKTVNNFVFLAREHFYDGLTFHRVIPGFVVQGGDPKGNGSGDPGYKFADELPKAGAYKVGSLAMANSGPNTNGSQFFIVTGAQGTQLPPKYSLFGTVSSGMDVVKQIEAGGASSGTPTTVHKMTKVTITES
ncbi:MAG TPA: peptidylprolyl isomerase [Acidimicrobiales bacterium]